MKPFLSQVADYYFKESDIEKMIFVFPNKRSMAFFGKYLCENVRSAHSRPILKPRMFTMNDFFGEMAGVSATPRIPLLIELYAHYKDIYLRLLKHDPEPLDDFIFWGDVILADFDDTDKYLADPRKLFVNVAEYRGMQDTMDYLTDTQRAALEKFINSFRMPKGAVPGGKDMKTRFLNIWNMLWPLYREFGEGLKAKGLAYEGMIYRGLAERLGNESVADIFSEHFPGSARIVFVGLNALNNCEKRLMSKLRDAGLADFIWDWQSDMIRDESNRSSLFMSVNLREFPMPDDFCLEPLGATPEVKVINIPSAVGQAKQLPGIFRRIAGDRPMKNVGTLDSGDGLDCAVVLPDESLLMPVLNSIPEEIDSVNVTMGYPMSASSFYSFLTDALSMQLHMRTKGACNLFYHKQVRSILTSNIFNQVKTAGDKAVADKVISDAKYYIPETDLGGTPLLRAIFTPVVNDMKSADAVQSANLARYIQSVVSAVAPRLVLNPGLAPELEFAKKCYDAAKYLQNVNLEILPVTFARLFHQLLGGQSVPFAGEPLKGLQIMGPLETRALDFSNVVILSCNEGVFPRKNVSASFIPHELRQGFGLPTYEHQDAVWAYYFYRLIQRASAVWLVTDTRPDKRRQGEASRYILQLEYDYRLPIEYYSATSNIHVEKGGESIPKPDDIKEKVTSMCLSATAIENYITCPVKFYYQNVLKLRKDDEIAESLDARTVGNVFHKVMQAIYLGEWAMDPGQAMDRESIKAALNEHPAMEFASKEYLKQWTALGAPLRAKVRAVIMEELRTVEVTGRNLVYENMICRYVNIVVKRELEYLGRVGADGFHILALEGWFGWKLGEYSFGGYIDRLDRVDTSSGSVIRVVDYKTGSVSEKESKITDGDARETADLLIPPAGETRNQNKDVPKIAMQVFVYDMFVKDSGFWHDGARLQNSIYGVSSLVTEGLTVEDESQEFSREMKERLPALLEEIVSTDKPFVMTSDENNCSYCNFKNICGRWQTKEK